MTTEIKYGLAKHSIEILVELARKVLVDKTYIEDFEIRCSDIHFLWDNFLLSYIGVETKRINNFDPNEHLKEYEYYENLIYEIKRIRSTVLNSDKMVDKSTQDVSSKIHQQSQFVIPKIHLPSFSGSIIAYSNFKNMFDSLIHNDSSLPPIQKMHYLVSCLKDEPYNLIKHLTICNENYSVALNIIHKRYFNPRLVAQQHIDLILNLPSLTSGKIQLRTFIDIILENVLALRTLEFDTDAWSFLLLCLIQKKLTPDLRSRFEIRYSEEEIPTFQQFLDFLESESKAHDVTKASYVDTSTNRKSKQCYAIGQFKQCTCALCKEGHHLFICPEFNEMSVNERMKVVKKNRLCFNCFGNHLLDKCLSKHCCKVCKEKHHTLIHVNKDSITPQSSSVLCASSMKTSNNILLFTACINIQDHVGNYHTVRAMIDPGSHCSIISESCVQRLKIKKHFTDVVISGVGNQSTGRVKGAVICNIKPIDKDGPVLPINAFVMKVITGNIPSYSLPYQIFEKFKHLPLADKEFHLSKQIDLLLGADVYNDIMDGEKITISPDLPSAYGSIFGFILLGKFGCTKNQINVYSHVSTLDGTLQRFWELEEFNSDISPLSPDEQACEEHFAKNTIREPNGRFMVRLPFRSSCPLLGETKEIATRRFYQLERKLSNDKDLKLEYSKFIHEYISLGYMERACFSDIKYFMAHHGVVKESSSTTRLRVVFDASMKSSNGNSLNDVLWSGPKLQQNIVDILLRFRTYKVVFTADIKKMYCQVLIHPDDHGYQGLLWRDSPEQELQAYKLTVVTFGVTSSPYLSMKCLLELAKDTDLSNAKRILQSDIFVDDILSGASSLDEALAYRNELFTLLKSAGFELRKWCSNSKQFLSDIQDQCVELKSFESDIVTKVLGVQWNPHGDFFQYRAHIFNNLLTKRSILSNIARVYDPCGWLCPVTFTAKVLMQEIWVMRLDWDESLPQHIERRWFNYIEKFNSLSLIKIDRCVVSDDNVYELHGFSDASELGYSASVYLRSESAEGNVQIHLLLAKSKVAPVKQRLTIPKLELSGAVLLAKLLSHVKNILSGSIEIKNMVAWCDSKIVLSWLKTPLHRLSIFEGSRVSRMHSLLDTSIWNFVPSALNPSDCSSRGLFPDELANHNLWWSPPWLQRPPSEWPSCKVVLQSCTTTNTLDPVTINQESCDLFDRYSSFTKLIRITALCLRFINNIRTKEKIVGFISIREYNYALITLVKNIQSSVFSKDIIHIQKNMSHLSALSSLHPFLDNDNVIRVGGRLRKSGLSETAKHPIILPKNHSFTNLLISYYHIKHLHAGPSFILSTIRQKFWILSGRDQVRKIIRKCIPCFKCRPRGIQPIMADLPSFRVTPARAFVHSGLDFGGPFYIKSSKLKGARTQKAYLCVIVCMATKAVHLELVSDLTTDAFLAALDRFVARRGLCRFIYSDWGTNFVGASNHFKDLHNFLAKSQTYPNVESYLLERQIQFKRNPPTASNFGGIFEAAVKSAKTLLKRVVGDTKLTFEELYTLFARIEAILNSRPLCPLTDNVEDLSVLTPAHFLVGESLLSVSEYCLSDITENRLSRWQLLQKFAQQLWKRWSKEYLHNLQQRSKWSKNAQNVETNAIVLIKEDNLPPLSWKIARVIELLPGDDGVVRVVKLKTSTGILVRPVNKICQLPLN